MKTTAIIGALAALLSGTAALAQASGPMGRGPAIRAGTRVSIDSLRNIKRGALLQRRVPPFYGNLPLPAPSLDGWTAVTNGGASSAPSLIAGNSSVGLLVRGDDGVYYIASVSPSQPAIPPKTAWSAVQAATKVTCSNFAESWSRCAGLGGPDQITMIAQDADDSSGNGWWSTIWASVGPLPSSRPPVSLNYIQYLQWDGNMGLAASDHADITAENIWQGAADNGYSWRKLTFSAFGDPVCAGDGDAPGACLLADGVGNKLSLFRWSSTDKKLVKAVDLPAVPGGGGMAAGEYALVWNAGTFTAFARSKSGELYASAQNGSGAFASWKSWGGIVAPGYAPSCLIFKDKPACAIHGPDHRIYVRWQAPSAGGL